MIGDYKIIVELILVIIIVWFCYFLISRNNNSLVKNYDKLEQKDYDPENPVKNADGYANTVKEYKKLIKNLKTKPNPTLVYKIYDRIRPDAHVPEIGDYYLPFQENDRMELEREWMEIQMVEINPAPIVDKQNVHDHTLCNIVDEQYKRIKELNKDQVLDDIDYIIVYIESRVKFNSPNEHNKINRAVEELRKIKNDKNVVIKLGNDTVCDLVRHVWILTNKENPWPLIEALDESTGVCTSGKVARILGSLAHTLDGENSSIGVLKTTAVIRQEILNDFSKIFAKHLDDNPGKKLLYECEEPTNEQQILLNEFKEEMRQILLKKCESYKSVDSKDKTNIVNEVLNSIFV
jgi:hypothetical protein